MRVVLDTVVFVRALINPHSRSGRLLSDYASRYTLIVSKPTAAELLEVIQRPELERKYSALGAIRIETIIDLIAQAQAVELADPPAVVRDPKDDIFVATAQAGSVDYLVTKDQDLLVLGDRFGFQIVNVEQFLAQFEGKA